MGNRVFSLENQLETREAQLTKLSEYECQIDQLAKKLLNWYSSLLTFKGRNYIVTAFYWFDLFVTFTQLRQDKSKEFQEKEREIESLVAQAKKMEVANENNEQVMRQLNETIRY